MVTVELVGEGSEEVAVGEDTTYGDLLDPFEVSPHEVTLTVDGRPVPEDAPVADDIDCVRVVRLIKGG